MGILDAPGLSKVVADSRYATITTVANKEPSISIGRAGSTAGQAVTLTPSGALGFTRPARVNLFPDPAFGHRTVLSAQGGATLALDTTRSHSGAQSLKATTGTDSYIGTVTLTGLVPGTTYTFAVWFYVPGSNVVASGQPYQLRLGATVTPANSPAVTARDQWARVSVTGVAAPSGNAALYVYGSNATGEACWVDDVTLIAESTPSDAFSGDGVSTLSAQFYWMGTPGSAASVVTSGQPLRTVSPEQFGALGDGVADDTAAVRAAFTTANAARVVGTGGNIYHPGAEVRLSGTYKLSTITSPILVSCNVDGAAAKLVGPVGYGQPILLVGHEVRGSILHDADIRLPHISGDSTGPTHVAGSEGVKVQNLNHSRLSMGRHTYFETSQHYTGLGQGTAYNVIFAGWTDLCKVGWRLDCGTDGLAWCNQNMWTGGSITQSPVFGLTERVAGWRHIVLDGSLGNIIDANTFVGASFEGNLSQYFIEIRRAKCNGFIGATRFEPGAAGRPVTNAANSATITTSTVHGFTVGDQVAFVAPPAGITEVAPYFVASVPATTTFTVSATKGGPAITPTSASIAQSAVYRCPTILVDYSTGSTGRNVISNPYSSFPGPIEVITTGTGPAYPALSSITV